jgi:hypothetical protein
MISEALSLELLLANVFNFERELKDQYMAISELLSDNNRLLFHDELDAIDRKSDAYKKENAPYITSDKYRTKSIIFRLWIYCTYRRDIMVDYIDTSDLEYIRKLEYKSKVYSIGLAYHNRAENIRQSSEDTQMNITLDMYSLPQSSAPVAAYYKNTAASKFKPVSYAKKNN